MSSREWRFSQCFGETAPVEQTDSASSHTFAPHPTRRKRLTPPEDADILSAVEFDQTGRFLATGDKGGRIVVFESEAGRGGSGSTPTDASSAAPGGGAAGDDATRTRRRSSRSNNHEYRFYCEFQSHEPEFDYLKSLEIEEKINQIKWCPPSAGAMFLLSTNDKTVIQWKIADKEVKEVQQFNLGTEALAAAEDAARGSVELSVMGAASLGGLTSKSRRAHTAAMKAASQAGFAPLKSSAQLVIPRLQATKSVIACTPRRTFANAHAYHINSISVNSDGETFLSADDLRINLWNLGLAEQQAFTIVDIKPENMEDLTEVITACEFHPSQCHTFAFSNSRGAIKLGDMRRSSLCDAHAKVFEEEEQPGDKSFFLSARPALDPTFHCNRVGDNREMLGKH